MSSKHNFLDLLHHDIYDIIGGFLDSGNDLSDRYYEGITLDSKKNGIRFLSVMIFCSKYYLYMVINAYKLNFEGFKLNHYLCAEQEFDNISKIILNRFDTYLEKKAVLYDFNPKHRFHLDLSQIRVLNKIEPDHMLNFISDKDTTRTFYISSNIVYTYMYLSYNNEDVYKIISELQKNNDTETISKFFDKVCRVIFDTKNIEMTKILFERDVNTILYRAINIILPYILYTGGGNCSSIITEYKSYTVALLNYINELISREPLFNKTILNQIERILNCCQDNPGFNWELMLKVFDIFPIGYNFSIIVLRAISTKLVFCEYEGFVHNILHRKIKNPNSFYSQIFDQIVMAAFPFRKKIIDLIVEYYSNYLSKENIKYIFSILEKNNDYSFAKESNIINKIFSDKDFLAELINESQDNNILCNEIICEIAFRSRVINIMKFDYYPLRIAISESKYEILKGFMDNKNNILIFDMIYAYNPKYKNDCMLDLFLDYVQFDFCKDDIKIFELLIKDPRSKLTPGIKKILQKYCNKTEYVSAIATTPHLKIHNYILEFLSVKNIKNCLFNFGLLLMNPKCQAVIKDYLPKDDDSELLEDNINFLRKNYDFLE